MDLETRITAHFAAHIETASATASSLADRIGLAARQLVESLIQGGKVLCCGTEGGAALAEYFTALMVHRFERERLGLPALTLGNSSTVLTSLAEAPGFEQVFSRQINALGQPGDILLLFAPGRIDSSLLLAREAAAERQMWVIALTGEDPGALSEPPREHDIGIAVPAGNAARVMESQLLVLHCLCDLIDTQLLGNL
jgi:D-sedoheptulose 7-phosphate isomerase